MTDDSPTRAPDSAAVDDGDVSSDTAGPGSSSVAHPSDGIPLPAHGFEHLDLATRELATIPAVEVVHRAAVMLMSASAEQLGLSPTDEPDLDLAEARILITALAGLLAASRDQPGPQTEALYDGLRTLQSAFREASSDPVAPGEGPGEKYLS